MTTQLQPTPTVDDDPQTEDVCRTYEDTRRAEWDQLVRAALAAANRRADAA
jgi:hypothetical protein